MHFNQRDIYGQAELAKDMGDELLEYFKYVVREESFTHHHKIGGKQGTCMRKIIVKLEES